MPMTYHNGAERQEYRIDVPSYQEQMTAWVEILKAQTRKPLYDFGWYLEHVPDYKLERGNK